MKKIVSYLLAATLPFVSVAGARNSLKEMKLKGNVATLYESVYAAKDTINLSDTTLISASVMTFSENGYLQFGSFYNAKRKLTSYESYTIDSMTALRSVVRSFFPDSAFKDKTVYKYDVAGNMMQENVYGRDDSLKPEVVNNYDPKAKEEPEFDSDEEKITIVITTHQSRNDPQGNWQMEVTYEKKVPISITLRKIEYFLKPEN